MWGDKAQERDRVHPCNVCDKAFKSLQMPSQHKIWQPSGHAFACKGCGKKFNPNNSINRHNKLVCGKPQHRKEEIILNVWGEEERKRTVLASSRKRADILYPLKWKSIVLVFNKFVCVMFFCLFFVYVSQDFLSKLIINVAINNYIILLLYEENIYI